MSAADLLEALAERFQTVFITCLGRAGVQLICLGRLDAPRVHAWGRTAEEAAVDALGLAPAIVCRRCRRELPPSAYHRHAGRAGGLHHACRACELARVKEAKGRCKAGGAVPRFRPASPPPPCLTCGKRKGPDGFRARRRSKTGWCANCKSCEAERWGPKADGP